MEWVRKYQNLWKKIGIAVTVGLAMKYLAPLVIPFLIAGAIVYWCRPLLAWLKKRLHIRPGISMAVLLIGAAGGLVSAGALAGRNLHIQIRRLCVYFSYPGRVGKLLAQCCERFGGMLHIDSRMMMQFVEEQTACIGDKTWEQLLPGVFGGSWQAVRVLGGFLTGAFVTGIAAILLAGDYDKLREMGQRWSVYENVSEALRGISRAIGRYLHAQCIIMGLVMLICTVGIWSLGNGEKPAAGRSRHRFSGRAADLRHGDGVCAMDSDSGHLAEAISGGCRVSCDLWSLHPDPGSFWSPGWWAPI